MTFTVSYDRPLPTTRTRSPMTAALREMRVGGSISPLTKTQAANATAFLRKLGGKGMMHKEGDTYTVFKTA